MTPHPAENLDAARVGRGRGACLTCAGTQGATGACPSRRRLGRRGGGEGGPTSPPPLPPATVRRRAGVADRHIPRGLALPGGGANMLQYTSQKTPDSIGLVGVG